MEDCENAPFADPNSSPAPPKICRQRTATGLGLTVSPPPPPPANGLLGMLGALSPPGFGAPGFARAPSSANSTYAQAASAPPHGSSPGATGRGLHATAGKPAAAPVPAFQSPPVMKTMSRADVIEEAFDAALWF
jgi:hypothetical protein